MTTIKVCLQCAYNFETFRRLTENKNPCKLLYCRGLSLNIRFGCPVGLEPTTFRTTSGSPKTRNQPLFTDVSASSFELFSCNFLLF